LSIIDKFRGEYSFLSNFYICSVIREDPCFPSLEHAFQAAKTLNPIEVQNILGKILMNVRKFLKVNKW